LQRCDPMPLEENERLLRKLRKKLRQIEHLGT
jgi:hypothetical protein